MHMKNKEQFRSRHLISGSIPFWVTVLIALTISSLAQAQQSGSYGAIPLGQAIDRTLEPAPAGGVAWHSFSVEVPSNVPVLTVQVDGFGHDIDLAAKFGSEILSYDDVDFLEVSADGNPRFQVQNPAAGTWHIDVFNGHATGAVYRLWVTAPVDGPVDGGNPNAESLKNRSRRPYQT
jgi:hypothetical protein